MGLGLFWKERGPTSSEQLGNIKRALGIGGPSRKGIGHGGTLDPFAAGWLLVGWDEGTKLLGALKSLSKTYIAEIYLGASTDTLDDTVPLEYWNEELKISEDQLREFLATQVGKHDQLPPLYSAKKVGGRASYELIRKGIELDLAPVPVEIFAAEHLSLVCETAERWRWTVRVKVSAGTYIRSLARDWGQALCGRPAILTELARVGYGNFIEASATDSKIMNNPQELESFFEFISTEQSRPEPCANKGHVLMDKAGELRAAWLIDSQRWRYFNGNPLS